VWQPLLLLAGVAAAATSGRWRVAYAAIAVLILADLIGLAITRTTLVGEAIALALFSVFWLAQTIQRWNEVDPGILPAPQR
jgi:hypothetical protein